MLCHGRTVGMLCTVGTLASAISSVAAHAADDIRYVSVAGSNANACTLAAPCRSLQRAIGVTAAGGEIRVLDSGFFGNNATIRNSLTISANGQTVYLGSAVIVDQADAVVTLRGLTLNGRGASHSGISIEAAAVVRIERCVAYGYSGNGIQSNAAGVEMFVTDSISRDNGGNGIFVEQAAGLSVDNSHFENNGATGVLVKNTNVTISRSTASGNGRSGIAAVAASVSVKSTQAAHNFDHGFHASFGSGSVSVESSVAVGNGNGLVVTNGARGRISNSTITANGAGIHNAGGFIETLQNNTIRDNTTNVSGALPIPIGGI